MFLYPEDNNDSILNYWHKWCLYWKLRGSWKASRTVNMAPDVEYSEKPNFFVMRNG